MLIEFCPLEHPQEPIIVNFRILVNINIPYSGIFCEPVFIKVGYSRVAKAVA
jgi:hypothetical protein